MRLTHIYPRAVVLLAVLWGGVSTLLLLFQAVATVEAAVHTVNPGESIQAAIDGATAGDTILVNAGIYTESLVLNKAVSLTGVSSDTTILNGPLNRRVISVAAGIDTSVIISGFTIQNGGRGVSPTEGGGMFLNGSPLLSHLVLTGNRAISDGGAILAKQDLHIQHSIGQNNEAISGAFLLSAGDLHMTHTTMLTHTETPLFCIAVVGQSFIRDSHIQGCLNANLFLSGTAYIYDSLITKGGKGVYGLSDLHLTSSIVSQNDGGGDQHGGGLHVKGSIYLTETQIIDNIAYGDGGGLYVLGNVFVLSSTIAFNEAQIAPLDDLSGPIYLGYAGNGGGIFAYGTIYLLDSVISSNTASLDGGGVYVSSTAYITRSTIESNSAIHGGGIARLEATVTLIDSQIRFNRAQNKLVNGFLQQSYGAAILADVAIIDHCVFEGNQAEGFYEGIAVSSYLTITNSIIKNHTYTGSYNSSPVVLSSGLISNTKISNNRSTLAGIVINPFHDMRPDSTSIISTSFENNYLSDGSVIYIETTDNGIISDSVQIRRTKVISNFGGGDGSILIVNGHASSAPLDISIANTTLKDGPTNIGNPLVYLSDGSVALDSVTIASDDVRSNVAIYISDTYASLHNSIIASYTNAVETNHTGLVFVDYNLFTSAAPFVGVNIISGSHNLTDTNPLFFTAGDYRLQANSPAIDAATSSFVTTDIAGNPRPGFGSALPDMGAYECDTAPILGDIQGAWDGNEVAWSWSGGRDYLIWHHPSPYQSIMGDGTLLNMASYQHEVGGAAVYFYTLASVSNCGIETETPQQLGLFTFDLAAGS